MPNKHTPHPTAGTDREDALAKLAQSIAALCQGRGTAADWQTAANAVDLARAIEHRRQGRGLHGHLDQIEDTLQTVHTRARRANFWLRPALTLHEMDTLRLLHELHSFQVHQLSRAEFLAAIDAAQRDGQAQGHTVTLARDLERLAA